jgi:hypothetical protein
MLCVALLATPSAFALLPQAEAGRLAGRMLALEAQVSLAFAVALLLLERAAARRAATAGQGSLFCGTMGFALGALFCTVAGHYGLQPMMAAARAGQGMSGFAALHTASVVFYAIKVALVAALVWRDSAAIRPPPSS